MDEKETKAKDTEQSLVKLYSELTGAGESTARAVFIHVDGAREEEKEKEKDKAEGKLPGGSGPS